MIQHLKEVHLFETLLEPEHETIGKKCKTEQAAKDAELFLEKRPSRC